ncbi:MAG: hypothetical protein RL653_1627 [Pseudomonadota bacterium]
MLPPHQVRPHSEAGSVPDEMDVHVPTVPERLQAWQVAEQAALQHTPSAHWPLWHCAPPVHAVPLASRHTPAPLQVVVPAHSLSGSEFSGTLVQVPTLPARLHDWHVPPHAALQHTPSTHCPLVHWLAAVQADAFAFFGVQVPPEQ